MKKRKSDLKKTFLSLVSLLALAVIGWILFFGKSKIGKLLPPLLEKVPKDEQKLTEYTEKALGKAVEAAKGGNLKKTVEKGSEVFENSQYAEPGRKIRDDVKLRIDEILQSIKELPAKELKIVKMEIYKRWFSDVATESGSQ